MIYLHYLQIPQFLYFTYCGHIYQIYNIYRGSAILLQECHHAALTANGLQTRELTGVQLAQNTVELG